MKFLKQRYRSKDPELVTTNKKYDVDAQVSNLLEPVSHIELDTAFERLIYHAKNTDG